MGKSTVAPILRFLEKVFVVATLILSTTAVIPVLRANMGFSYSVAAGDPLIQALWLGVYGLAGVALLFRYRSAVRLILSNWPLFLLVGLTLLSVFWSYAPPVTLRRGTALIGTSFFGLFFALRFSFSEQVRLLATAMSLIAAASWVFALFYPNIGIHYGLYDGAWRGVFHHKNELGRMMTLAVGVNLALLSTRPWKALAGLTMAVPLIVLSTSKSALVVVLTLLLLVPVFRTLRTKSSRMIPLAAGAVLLAGSLAMWLATNSERVLALLGRESTLTGRTELWSILLREIWRYPLLGYGYHGFWPGQHPAVRTVWNAVGWEAWHAHNGLLDLWLDLGLLGVGIFVWITVQFTRRAVQAFRSSKTSETLWPLLFLSFMLLYNLTESAILLQNSIFWILYVATALALARAAAVLRRASFFPLPNPDERQASNSSLPGSPAPVL